MQYMQTEYGVHIQHSLSHKSHRRLPLASSPDSAHRGVSGVHGYMPPLPRYQAQHRTKYSMQSIVRTEVVTTPYLDLAMARTYGIEINICSLQNRHPSDMQFCHCGCEVFYVPGSVEQGFSLAQAT